MSTINVTVVYALSNIQHIYKVKIKLGSTIKEAILASKILKIVKNLNIYKNIGVYNKIVHVNTRAKDGDRIEIYRNLIVDPKERRRKKFLLKKKQIT